MEPMIWGNKDNKTQLYACVLVYIYENRLRWQLLLDHPLMNWVTIVGCTPEYVGLYTKPATFSSDHYGNN